MILAFLIGVAFKIPSSSVSWSTTEGCDGGMVPWARGDVIISGLGSPKEVLGERISEQVLDLRGYPKKQNMGSGELR